LQNPINDANDLYEALHHLGFDVMKGTNLTHQGMERATWTASGLHSENPFYFISPTSIKPPKNPPPSTPHPGTAGKKKIGKYIDNYDGTITDTETNLMWKRCSEGLEGKNCEKGEVKRYEWDDAVKRFKNVDYAGYSDWRMPTIDELKTLLYCSKGVNDVECHDGTDGNCNDGSEKPTINQQAFPNTQLDWYWSGSQNANHPDSAWIVDFSSGSSTINLFTVRRLHLVGVSISSSSYHSNVRAVRLVRGGQPSKKPPQGNPNPGTAKKTKIGKYIDNHDGTITDTETNLMWKRCSEGLSNLLDLYSWGAAVKHPMNVDYAGYADWRMPTIDELKTLVYCSKGVKNKNDGECNDGSEKPTINQQAFPNTQLDWYWSGSPYANYSDSAWSVDFSSGSSTTQYHTNFFTVRLVRGGQ
jgi:hypothetical protein